jgi:ribosomal protein S6--L-glutamate ligase
MRFAIIAEGRYLNQRMPLALVRELQNKGHTADVIRSDDQVCELGSPPFQFGSYDSVMCRDRSIMGLFLLALAERSGVRAINSRAAIEGVRNKSEMSAALVAGGIPMPETVVCAGLRQLQGLHYSFYPFVLKPNFGDNGNGILLVRTPDDLPGAASEYGSIALAQEFVPNDGYDLKLYVAGESVWAVRKANIWAGIGNGVGSELVPVDDEMRCLALRCGRLLDLEVYGVDTLPTAEGLKVLEVNEFPNFTGIDDAPAVLADLLVAKAAQFRTRGSARSPEIVSRNGVGHA